MIAGSPTDVSRRTRDMVPWTRLDGQTRWIWWPEPSGPGLGVQLTTQPLPLLHHFPWWQRMIDALLFI